MEDIEHCRRTSSKKLLKFLINMGYPDNKIWEHFSPNAGLLTNKISGKILLHFSEQIPHIESVIDKVTIDSHYKEPLTSRYGKFIDYIVELSENADFSSKYKKISNDIQLASGAGDKKKLHYILNKHHRIFIPYWEKCNLAESVKCECPSHLNDIYNFFASPDIQEDIEKNLIGYTAISGNIYNKDFNLGIYYDPSIGIRKGRRRGLLMRLSLMLSLAISKETTNTVSVNIWLSSNQKLIHGLDENFLGIMNINSGCTIRDYNSYPIGRVIIWRDEECDKVLVHELIHALGLDFHIYDKSIDNEIFHKFDINSKDHINIFETYTETWTVILSTIMYSKLCGNGTIPEVSNLLRLETAYSMVQISKILVYYKYQTFSNCDFFCPDGFIKSTRKNKFKQGTSILAYYIFKAALLYNLDEFLFICDLDRDNPWKFKGDVDKFWEIIKISINKPGFISTIDNLIKYYKMIETRDRNSKSDNFYHQSLRMTLHEFRS